MKDCNELYAISTFECESLPGGIAGACREKLEKIDATHFCLDESPDVFFTVEYLSEGTDRSLCIDIPFGAEEAVMSSVLDFVTHVEKKCRCRFWILKSEGS